MDQNLTPEQRAMPTSVRKKSYERVPKTCDNLRKLLDQAGRELQQSFRIDETDYPEIDAVISRTFLAIRDEITQPFRTEQMKLLRMLSLRWGWPNIRDVNDMPDDDAEMRDDAINCLAGCDIHQQMADEFGVQRVDVKNALFLVFYRTGRSDRHADENFIDYCRRKLMEMGWQPKKPSTSTPPVASPNGSAD